MFKFIEIILGVTIGVFLGGMALMNPSAIKSYTQNALDYIREEKADNPLGSSVRYRTHELASTDSTDEVGPDENVQVVATTSRSYLKITSEGGGNVPVYCKADADKEAVTSEGIKLATSTSMSHEWAGDKGNLYRGGVRCTATASTTILISEYLQ